MKNLSWKNVLILFGIAVLAFFAFAAVVVTMIGEEKRHLDERRLTRFAENLSENLKDAKKRAALAAIPEQKTSRELFLQMYNQGVISLNDCKKLAGVSGIEAADDNYSLENADELTNENIIFTMAKSGQAFLDLFEGRTRGIAIAYNQEFIGKYPDYGVVGPLFRRTQSADDPLG